MEQKIGEYRAYLLEEEKSAATVAQYVREAERFAGYLKGKELSKETVIAYKADLVERYKPSSVNVKLAAVKGFLSFLGRADLRARRSSPLRGRPGW